MRGNVKACDFLKTVFVGLEIKSAKDNMDTLEF